MLDDGAKQAVQDALGKVKEGFKLEFSSDPGRLNAYWIAYGFAIILILGAPNLLVPVIKIWQPKYSADFPLLPVFAIYTGGFLICVALLVALAALIRPNRGSRQVDSPALRAQPSRPRRGMRPPS